MAYINCALDILMFLVLCIVLSGSFRIYRMEPGQSRFFIVLIILAAIGNLSQAVFWSMTARGLGSSLICSVADDIYYLSFYGLLVTFVYFVTDYVTGKDKASRRYAHASIPLALIYAIIWIMPRSRDLLYTPDPDSGVIRQSFYILGSVGGYIIAMLAVIVIIRHRAMLEKHEIIALLSFMVLPAAANILGIFSGGLSLMPITLALSVIIIRNYFQYRSVKLIHEQRMQLKEDKTRIMLSQIRPHFIYNVLNSIYYLCGTDPVRAQEAISVFSRYLRRNLESIEKNDLIPINDELEHVRLYMELEKMRFDDRLSVSYDIDGDVDVRLPPLSIQPIAENAVKHGVYENVRGGTVTLRIRKEAGGCIITVADDGVGFDPDTLPSDDRSHIGLANVRERIEALCGGTLDVKSSPGQGTTVTIFIPENKKR